MPNNIQQDDAKITIAWSDFVRFLRQMSHDIRNHLNAAELQTAYLSEIAESAELKDEIKRLREMVGEVTRSLQKIIAKVTPISATRMEYRCSDLIEDVQQKLASAGGSKVQWEVQLGSETFEVDPQLLLDAIVELLDNAGREQSAANALVASAKIANGNFEFTLREPKKEFEGPTENWGRQPLRNVGRGHYGLGLNRVRMIVEEHDGDFSASYDPQIHTLSTQIVLPLRASG